MITSNLHLVDFVIYKNFFRLKIFDANGSNGPKRRLFIIKWKIIQIYKIENKLLIIHKNYMQRKIYTNSILLWISILNLMSHINIRVLIKITFRHVMSITGIYFNLIKSNTSDKVSKYWYTIIRSSK